MDRPSAVNIFNLPSTLHLTFVDVAHLFIFSFTSGLKTYIKYIFPRSSLGGTHTNFQLHRIITMWLVQLEWFKEMDEREYRLLKKNCFMETKSSQETEQN